MPFAAPNYRPPDLPAPRPIQTEAASRLDGLPELVSRKEAMTFLGLLSTRAFRTMVAQGKFPRPIQINQRLHRWRRVDIVAWYAATMEQNPPTATAD